MFVVTRVQKWGNSQGLRVSKDLLEKVNISIGDAVQVSVRKGMILIKPVRQSRKKYDLRQLIAKMPKGYQPDNEEWGKPMGREIW